MYQIRDADTALGQLIARVSFNYPGSSGKILSVRSSLSHLKHFIDHFEIEEGLKGRKEYGKLVHQYNDTGMILMKFECKVESDSRNPSIRQIETMIAKPVLEGQRAGSLQLNFDPILYHMLQFYQWQHEA